MKVLLVGGSPPVDHLDLRADYPGWIVCQLNNNWQRRPQQPVDWLFFRRSSGVKIPEIPRSCQIFAEGPLSFYDFIDWPRVYEVFMDARYLKTNPYGSIFEWCNVLGKRVKTSPLIGIIAITRILMEPALEQLKVIGFDFYGGDKLEVGGHYLPTQKEYLKELAEVDARLVLEPELEELLGVDRLSRFATFQIESCKT